jgi:beta-N-acetylhexosaminidase
MLIRNWILIIIIFMSAIFQSCEKRMDNKALQIIQQMPLSLKIGQMLIVGIPDRKNNSDTDSIISNYFPGGIVLFGYNLGNEDEIKNYIRDMQKTVFEKYNIPLFVSIDQEGGRVRRIQSGVTQFPGNMAFGIANNKELTYQAARILGLELRNMGINMNLAPVLDVNNNPMNPVINTRSFGSDAEIVSRLGVEYVKGLQKSGCISVGKHFPGHGDTDKDSHLTLPVIRYNIERLRQIEFPPFVHAIESGVEAIMTAHISYPEILKDNSSATISKIFLTDLLRKEMRFRGIIITDDMEMNAISKTMDMGEAAVRSIEAGTDLILISTHGNSINTVVKAIEKALADNRITMARIDESVRKIMELKLRYKIMDVKDGLITNPQVINSNDDLEILKNADELNKRVSREAIYYYNKNNTSGIIVDDSARKLFISSSEFFRKEIESAYKANDYKIFYSEKEFVKFMNKEMSDNKAKINLNNTFVYYNVDKVVPASIDRINGLVQAAGAKLFLLCTGNPFPLGEVKNMPLAIISFSNTNESIRQIIACLKGEFSPKEKIPLHLGFSGQ